MTNSEEPSAPDTVSSMTTIKGVSDGFTATGTNGATGDKIVNGCSTTGVGNNISNTGSAVSVRSAVAVSKDPMTESEDSHLLPFARIYGEQFTHKQETTEGVLVLTTYRLFINGKDTNFNLPLGLIDYVECRDIFFLHIHCKDARYLKVIFPNNEVATEVLRKIQTAISSPKNIQDYFAFTFYKATSETQHEDVKIQLGLLDYSHRQTTAYERFLAEIKRMEFEYEQGPWRISKENDNYELCNSYPKHMIVPVNTNLQKLKLAANFRSARRFPAVVWRHRRNGAVISRCSQPEVGWFGWRSQEDEELVQNIVEACAYNNPQNVGMYPPSQPSDSENSNTSLPGGSSIEMVPFAPDTKKLLILDARSYTTAVANRARGGGCECLEYYNNCEIQFMNLANIHSIRKSFINVRQLCALPSDQVNWFSQLENCKWLQHMSGLMKAAMTVVTAVERDGRPVMVHCSDGWDRTPQIVSLAEILLDSYYRSLEGFQVLVEREWLDYGHKFGDRCGQGVGADDANERCPVFLQWIDCLHQLIRQFPSAFEFNLSYLVKLAQHTYSNLFGTFLCNTSKEREQYDVASYTRSVWSFLRASASYYKFRNHLYNSCDKVLWPSCEVRDLFLWSQVYLGYENLTPLLTEVVNPSQDSSPAPSVSGAEGDAERLERCKPVLKSSKSCEDLINHHSECEGLQRRQSDPSLCDSFSAAVAENEIFTTSQEQLANSVPHVLLSRDHTNGAGELQSDSRTKDLEDSENDDTEPNSEGKSESTVINTFRIDLKSIESSTDTLVAESGVLSDSHIHKPFTGVKTEQSTKPANISQQVNSYSSSIPKERRTSSPVLNSDPLVLFTNGLGDIDNEGPDQHSQAFISDEGSTVIDNSAMNLPNGLPIEVLMSHCEICAMSQKVLRDFGHTATAATSTSTSSGSSGIGMASCSKYSSYNTPVHSRTPSTGIPATPSDEHNVLPTSRHHERNGIDNSTISSSHGGLRSAFDVDGLATLHDEVQSRLNSLVHNYRGQLDSLQRELKVTREALLKQVGHKCTRHSCDRADDAVSVDSQCSGEHHSVSNESHSSEISWEAVDEKDTRPPLWLPDYAVSKCMGCDGTFWFGRRKHHCRSCGKVFCAECSEQKITIPSEQLFTPVRVCFQCYHRHSSQAGSVPMSYAAAATNGTCYPRTTNSHQSNISVNSQQALRSESGLGCTSASAVPILHMNHSATSHASTNHHMVLKNPKQKFPAPVANSNVMTHSNQTVGKGMNSTDQNAQLNS